MAIDADNDCEATEACAQCGTEYMPPVFDIGDICCLNSDAFDNGPRMTVEMVDDDGDVHVVWTDAAGCVHRNCFDEALLTQITVESLLSSEPDASELN